MLMIYVVRQYFMSYVNDLLWLPANKSHCSLAIILDHLGVVILSLDCFSLETAVSCWERFSLRISSLMVKRGKSGSIADCVIPSRIFLGILWLIHIDFHKHSLLTSLVWGWDLEFFERVLDIAGEVKASQCIPLDVMYYTSHESQAK